MNIKFSDYDLSEFILRERDIAGKKCVLVFPPHIGSKWTKATLMFRSSIWTEDGDLVSASYKKFHNWGEQPDLTYTPFSLTANGGVQIMEKLDGSTLIVSKYKGEWVIRTRGTFDATELNNGHEITELKEKFKDLVEQYDSVQGGNYSFLFEWVTPENKIVLDYGEPDVYLTGIIDHADYSLLSQIELDVLGVEFGLKRPKTYSYPSIKAMVEDVPTWEGGEGVCVYCNKGQNIRKLKSEWYKTLHRMKSELGSYERVVDFFFAADMPDYQLFYQTIVDTLDFEVAERCRNDLSRICDGYKEVLKIVEFMTNYANENKHLDRKTFALNTIQKWGKTNRQSFVFGLYDGKPLSKDNLKKLLYQVTKK